MKNNYIKNSFKLIKNNIKTVLGFEIIFKLVVCLIIIPFSITGFNYVMQLTGYTYLTGENILGFIIHPFNIIFILLIIIFLIFITLIDISTLIVIFDQSYHNKKITILDSFKTAFIRLKNSFKLKNISILLLVLFLIPFLNIGIISSVITSINIPKFITNFIVNNKIIFIIFLILLIFLIAYLMNLIYSFHYMILERKKFNDAKIASKKLIEKSNIKDMFRLLFVQIIIYLVYLLIAIFGIYIITLFNNILGDYKIIESILITVIWIFILISLLFFSISSNAISYAVLSSLYYKHKLDNNRPIIEIDYYKSVNSKKINKIFKLLINIAIIFLFMGGSILTYQVINGNIDLNATNTENIEITAHRGASANYPENTMSAFVGAKELNADWIELDVHQTKDFQLVVIHDPNFKRVGNVNKKVSELTYKEIQNIDVGSHFNSEYSEERAPLLEDVIKYAKENNIKLNIELKPTGTEVDFEKQVVDLINKYDYKDNCVVASFNYDVLEKTKEIDPDIKTLYVMSFAIGNIIDLSAADGYSIEASNIKYTLVARIHNSGKKIFVWTINDEATLYKMIDLNVDNIITNDVNLAKEALYYGQEVNIINELIKALI